MYIAGLVIAILGLIVGLIPILGWFALPLNIGAVVIGAIGIKRKLEIEKNHYQMAVASIILGAIPLILKIMSFNSLLNLMK